MLHVPAAVQAGAMKGVLQNIINMINAHWWCQLLQMFLLLTLYISTCSTATAAESQHFNQQPESLTVTAGELVRFADVETR